MIKFLGRLWNFVRPYRSRLVLGLMFGILFALANVFLALAVRVVMNTVFRTEGEGSSLDKQLAHIRIDWVRHLVEQILDRVQARQTSRPDAILMICAIPLIMMFRSLFAYLNVYLVSWSAVRAVADLRVKLFDHLQNLPLGFFHKASTGELISRVTSDTQQLQSIIGQSFASLIRDPITIIALGVMLVSQQAKLTVISMIVLPVCIVPVTLYGRRVRKSAKAMQAHAADMAKVMHESFTGNRIIKAYNLEDVVVAQFRAVTRKYISHIMRIVRANEIPGSVMEFLAAVGVALVLLYVVYYSEAKPGDFFAFIMSIFLMYQPIKSLTKLHNQLHQAEAASQRVFELLDTPSSIVEPVNPLPLKAAHADIHFEAIDFDYGEKPVLRGINLTVKAGQLVALVGGSGSGKTTLVNLLPRFYDPQHGVVRIGQTDIRDVSIRDLRRQIAVVTQETILFHETIRRNIAMGRPDATDAEIEAAARHANAHEFILQKEAGYEAIMGERGVTLSGGQRQRVSIARAILKDAPILILDEATSSLDAEAERLVQGELEKLMQGRTTICIAHRLSTIQKADVIVVLHEGKIAETGTHAQLLQRGGVYQRLYELQFQS